MITKNKEKNFSLRERLKAWNELLNSVDGCTYDDVEYKLTRKEGLDPVKKEGLRQDVKYIKGLVESTDAEIVTHKKKGKNCFSLSSCVDLIALYDESKIAKPHKAILELLTRCHGFLPEDFLSTISQSYREIIDRQENNYVVGFDTDYSIMYEMKYFSLVYSAINKNGLLVTKCMSSDRSSTEKVVVYPEFLKQYRSEWYVLGTIIDYESGLVKNKPGRFALNTIKEVQTLNAREYPFISSDTDYMDYFEEIVGVEYDKNCALEDVRFYISNEMCPRIDNNPIHCSQKKDSSVKIKPGYKAYTIKVRKNKELVRTLLAYGKDLIVISPEKLKNQVRKEIEKSLEKYR